MIFNLKIFEQIPDTEIKSKNDILCINILLVISLLLPLFLLTGPFLPDLTIVLCALFFIYLTFKYKLFHYYNNLLVKFLIFFWVYISINSLLAENIFFSLKSSFFYIRFLLFSLFIFFLITNYKYFIKYFFIF